MREIKFRAWDKKTKKMREVNSIAFHNDKGNFDDCGNDKSPKVVCLWGFDIIEDKNIILQREKNEVILMQYTGLKDKNGKEIYEGDIVKDRYGNHLQVEWTDANKCSVYYGRVPDRPWGYPIDANDEVKIIGNIYENSDLLKEKA